MGVRTHSQAGSPSQAQTLGAPRQPGPSPGAARGQRAAERRSTLRCLRPRAAARRPAPTLPGCHRRASAGSALPVAARGLFLPDPCGASALGPGACSPVQQESPRTSGPFRSTGQASTGQTARPPIFRWAAWAPGGGGACPAPPSTCTGTCVSLDVAKGHGRSDRFKGTSPGSWSRH